jgi:outer membrane protein TolC
MGRPGRARRRLAAAAIVLLAARGVEAQSNLAQPGAPQPAPPRPAMPRVTFAEAIATAVERNPTVKQAADGILQAQALLGQATALIMPTVAGGVTATLLNAAQSLNGQTATSRGNVVGSLTVSAPLVAPVQWALRAQAMDARRVAELSAADIRKQVAVAAADACLSIVALRQVLDADLRARDVAKAHYDDASERRIAGAGSRLNELRAEQSFSSDQALVETAQANLYQAQEALGVLLAADGPADLADQPVLVVPPSLDAALDAMPLARTDLLLLVGRKNLAARVLSDSWKDWLPSVTGMFTPQLTRPETLLQQGWSWSAQAVATIPIFDSGYRRASKALREVGLDTVKLEEEAALRQARSEARAARDLLGAAERALRFAVDAADQAHQVVEMVLVSFRVGASTNIEVIDAQRVALDADTAVAVAEHDVRLARLNLLVALGLFPRL